MEISACLWAHVAGKRNFYFFIMSTGNDWSCEHGGVDLMGLKPNPLDLSSFSALTLLVGSFHP